MIIKPFYSHNNEPVKRVETVKASQVSKNPLVIEKQVVVERPVDYYPVINLLKISYIEQCLNFLSIDCLELYNSTLLWKFSNFI